MGADGKLKTSRKGIDKPPPWWYNKDKERG